MTDYKVELNKIIKDEIKGKQKTEIWANITNLNTNESMDKLIFWKDDNGVLHDETPNLPTEIRDKIDNLWIEKKRIW
jgi:hypothetical protein